MDPQKIVAEVLTWSNPYDAEHAIDAAELDREFIEVIPIDM